MNLSKEKYRILLNKVSQEKVEYARLFYYLKFVPQKIEKIWSDDSEHPTELIAQIKPSMFQEKHNALVWTAYNANFDWLSEFELPDYPLHFRCVPERAFYLLQNVWNVKAELNTNLWYLPEDAELRQPFFQIQSLREEDIPEVDKNWVFGKGRDLKKYLKQKIRMGDTFAIYIQDHLASYAIFRENGSMGLLRTLPQFREKGLAKSITYAMAKEARNRDWIPHCFIEPNNIPSRKVVSACGFKKNGSQYWFVVK